MKKTEDLSRLQEDLEAILELIQTYEEAGDEKGLEELLNSEMVFNLYLKIKKLK